MLKRSIAVNVSPLQGVIESVEAWFGYRYVESIPGCGGDLYFPPTRQPLNITVIARSEARAIARTRDEAIPRNERLNKCWRLLRPDEKSGLAMTPFFGDLLISPRPPSLPLSFSFLQSKHRMLESTAHR
jgi:hypothetical protein